MKARRKPTAKQVAYAVARAKGRTRRNALRDAGYQPANDANARALACQVERSLRDRNVLDDALRAEGLGPERFARGLRKLLDSDDTEALVAGLDRLSRVLGYEKPEPAAAATPFDALPFAERLNIAAVLASVQRIGGPVAGGGGLDAGADSPGERTRVGGQSAAFDPPPPPGHYPAAPV